MESKDYLLLGIGGFVGIIGSLIAARIDRTISNVLQIRAQRVNDRNRTKEIENFIRLRKLYRAHNPTVYFVIVSVGALIICVTGIVGAFSFATLSIVLRVSTLPGTVSSLTSWMMISLEFVGLIFTIRGALRLAKLRKDYNRLENFDNYQQDIEKLNGGPIP